MQKQERHDNASRLAVDSALMGLLEDIARAIEDAEARGMTRYRIAKEAKVSEATLSKFVNNPARGLRVQTIEKLADFLGLEISVKRRRGRS